jgi:hypothetical protein
MRLHKVALTGRAVELAPGAAVRMAIGAQIAQTEPASVVTTGMRTKMPGGIDRTRVSVRRGHRVGRYRKRRLGRCGLSLTQGTVGLVRQARKRCGRVSAGALGWHRLRLG